MGSRTRTDPPSDGGRPGRRKAPAAGKAASRGSQGAAGARKGARSASCVAEALSGRPPGSMTLVIAEKPSVGRDIARALRRRGEAYGDHGSFLVGRETVITWAVGHLLELCEPEDYDPSWRRWRLEGLPIIPPEFRLRPIERTKAQLDVVLALMRSPVFKELVNACDAGREGELIFRHLVQAAGVDLPVKRLWVSAMTDEAILEGFDDLRDGRDFERLEAAARCRSESDWLVGINATRGMTRRCGVLLSVGRVQTPTLAILAEREKAIREFRPEKYFVVEASFAADRGGYRGTWVGPGGDEDRVKDPDEARAVADRVAGGEGCVLSVTSRSRTHHPPLLYDLTQLQRDMNRRYGLSASRTLRLAQDLYEKHKVITYPRTDSRFLAGRNIPLLRSTLKAVAGVSPELAAAAGPVLEAERLPISGRLVNDARVRDHHAIIPTLKADAAAGLKGDHRKVFEAVARRFVGAFYPPAVVVNTTVVTAVGEDLFRSRGRTVREKGWLAVEEAPWLERQEGEQALPELHEGAAVAVEGVEVLEKETRPPPRYTEATLLQTMDTAGRLVDDEELQEAMKDKGLGTPATRAAIIERLIEVGYVERDRRSLVVTPKGAELVAVIPTRDLVSPALTGLWESKLRAVERGELSREAFMSEIKGFVERLVGDIKILDVEGASERMRRVVGTCPRCGADVVEGKRAFSCSRWKTDGCSFYIWKTVAGRRVTAAEASALLERGRTRLLRGFRSKKGRRFAAYLVLEDGEVRFAFPESKGRRREGLEGGGASGEH